MLAVITIGLVLFTFVSFVIGAIGLAKYAFRLGTGPGLMVLLFPPYTFYFAFYKLTHEDKDRPTAMWMFGLLATILLVFVFQHPLSLAARGDWSALEAPKEEAPKPKYVPQPDKPAAPDPTPAPAAPTGDAAAAPVDGQAAPAVDGQAAPAADGQAAPAVAPTGDQAAAPAADGQAAPAAAAPAADAQAAPAAAPAAPAAAPTP